MGRTACWANVLEPKLQALAARDTTKKERSAVDRRVLDGRVAVVKQWWCWCGGMARCLLDVHFLLAGFWLAG